MLVQKDQVKEMQQIAVDVKRRFLLDIDVSIFAFMLCFNYNSLNA